MFTTRPHKTHLLLPLAAAALSWVRCGDDPMMEPPPPPPTVLLYDVADPCQATVPLPNDVFRDETGLDERAVCTPPADPIEAALQAALADDGVALDAKIRIPFEGSGIDLATLTASAAFALTGTSSAADAPIPPTLLLALPASATSTDAGAWRLLSHLVSRTPDGSIELTPEMPFEHGGYYVAVTTDTIKDEAKPQKPIVQAPATKALVGVAPIVAGAFEGLDAATAARLERERLRLAPVVQLLASASPPIAGTRIRSIQGFRTALGFQRLLGVVDQYRAALTDTRITFSVETTGGDIPPADIYPVGTPMSVFEQVLAFRRGTIGVPRLLGDDGYLRSDWATEVQTIRVPFLISIPRGGGGYRTAIYLPGFLRSKQDARDLANAFAGAPRAAVMGIDLRCHGDRSLDATGVCKDGRTPAEVGALVDMNSNGNPERSGADGVPDNSGAGFFPADARKLRDAQIASIIEVVHIIETFQRGVAAFNQAGLQPNPNDLHMIGHGHSAQIAVAAASLSRAAMRTVMLPSGGAKVSDLVLSGPAPVKDAFNASLPTGVTPDMAQAYLTRVERDVLSAVSYEELAALANDRYIRISQQSPRILLPHGSLAQHVPMSARTALIQALGLDAVANRVSAHNGACDTFYIHQCMLGDNIAWGERARDQLASFAASGGVTVLAPAQ